MKSLQGRTEFEFITPGGYVYPVRFTFRNNIVNIFSGLLLCTAFKPNSQDMQLVFLVYVSPEWSFKQTIWRDSTVWAPHLTEVRVDVLSARLVQLRTADLLGKAGDPDDVGRLQVLCEEITTRLGHVLHLISSQEQDKSKTWGESRPSNSPVSLEAALPFRSVYLMAAKSRCSTHFSPTVMRDV